MFKAGQAGVDNAAHTHVQTGQMVEDVSSAGLQPVLLPVSSTFIDVFATAGHIQRASDAVGVAIDVARHGCPALLPTLIVFVPTCVDGS